MTQKSLHSRARAAWRRWRFERSGMKPWTKGYDEYKHREIERVLREGGFSSETLPAGFGFRLDERIVEYPWLFSRLPSGPGTLLDAGSVLNHDLFFELPALKAKKVHICTLAPESECFWDQGVSYLFGDLRSLPYRDNWFDWVVCLSTLEHVGMDNTLLYSHDPVHKEARPQDCLAAVHELKRVLKPGGTLYASVPFGKAVNHGWLQIFDQAGIDSLIAAFAPRATIARYFLYSTGGWQPATSATAANATFFDIHHAPTYDNDFAASARAVCCLELQS